jgi:hypothetical protein
MGCKFRGCRGGVGTEPLGPPDTLFSPSVVVPPTRGSPTPRLQRLVNFHPGLSSNFSPAADGRKGPRSSSSHLWLIWGHLMSIHSDRSKSAHYDKEGHPYLTIPRTLRVLCQEPGTETRYLFLQCQGSIWAHTLTSTSPEGARYIPLTRLASAQGLKT